uniref:F-box domain-containing protein n=1 Tax=Leersia perrieri TaxID=77586 RepID=A0A0D9VX98_9ORYZ
MCQFVKHVHSNKGHLRRLAPRCLAVSRCVCKPWRDLVDERRLLRVADLLPHSLAGFFVNFHNLFDSEFFARPSITGTAASGIFSFLPDTEEFSSSLVEDHCNGLLLFWLSDCVVNPAMGWWARLPPRPPPCKKMDYSHDPYLVFDPAVSPHYEVFLIQTFHLPCDPRYSKRRDHVPDLAVETSEWPPTSYALPVFSSKEGLWQERSFHREGEAACTITDMRLGRNRDQKRNAVYWRGALYIHCQTDFLIRISLNDDSYQVIKTPEYSGSYYDFYLGRSQNGVYLALYEGGCLQVWILDETCSKIRWELKHNKDIKHILLGRNNRQGLGPWILQDIYEDDIMEMLEQNKVKCDPDKEAALEKFEWISDDENALDNDDRVMRGSHGHIDIIGFHPYKEILFLGESLKTGLAYHLNSSKIEDIGDLYPPYCDLELINEQFITASFPYTPCLM